MPSEVMPLVSIVIPCFNNEHQLEHTCRAVSQIAAELAESVIEFELILIDDASTDSTWSCICSIKTQLKIPVRGLRLAHNCGAYIALVSGLKCANGDAVVVMAADGDDPASELPNLIRAWQTGVELVQAARISRSGTLANKAFGRMYYGLLSAVGVRNLPANGSDFMLADRAMLHKFLSHGFKPGNTLIQLYQHAENVHVLTYTKGARPSHGWTTLKKLDLFFFSLFTALYSRKMLAFALGIVLFLIPILAVLITPIASITLVLPQLVVLFLWRYTTAQQNQIPIVAESV
jgi:glycosyltransferase involved in cell wall biosynthesis